MSHCRFSVFSDVYVFYNTSGHYECCACKLSTSPFSFQCDTAAEMVEHLWQHVAAGHVVPTDAIAALEREGSDVAQSE